MSELYQSLSPAKWDCQYPVVFVPKRRRQAVFGATRRQLGPIFHALARQKECRILEGPLLPDHVHMCIAIPPKHPVSSVSGFIKGKSAIAIARRHGKERNLTGEHFWARGYAVSTVGFEWEQVRQYIREQEDADGRSGQF
jgi:putative transposase